MSKSNYIVLLSGEERVLLPIPVSCRKKKNLARGSVAVNALERRPNRAISKGGGGGG